MDLTDTQKKVIGITAAIFIVLILILIIAFILWSVFSDSDLKLFAGSPAAEYSIIDDINSMLG
jgi:sensor domain CHASE-containing protein